MHSITTAKPVDTTTGGGASPYRYAVTWTCTCGEASTALGSTPENAKTKATRAQSTHRRGGGVHPMLRRAAR